MSTYFGDHGRMGIDSGPPDLETLMAVADRLIEALGAEYPALVVHGETVHRQLEESTEDGLPPNRGKIRTALEEVAIVAGAGTGSLTFTRQLLHALDL
ncbi:hypothetical protein A6P39_011335 [Streptomyces sp. FXJ1.172]|uniref:hypothetical protein n=1 Tax=Streptomyces sp. FXJ1.172 TaxID=710705 RepID=UPI0007CFED90|nr:hypothetical protein [Streptomyces sp. FXJ1.172]WEO94553.1 hypothetical protein A6P39_011335 [Streptomyces sp. FXJ1.172]